LAAPLDKADSPPPLGGEAGSAPARRVPVLLVRARSLTCALPLSATVETLRPLPVQEVQGMPGFLRGLAVIRGQAVPVVDLGVLLGSREPARTTRYVTVRAAQGEIALAVEAVLGTSVFDPAALQVMPPLLRDTRPELVEMIGVRDQQLLLLLRAARLLTADEWHRLAEGEGGA
jgi:purine-binding chemotaxis protein CheW